MLRTGPPFADEQQEMDDIRVLVVDEGDTLAESLSVLLPPRSNVIVIGPVSDPNEAAARFDDGSVDVAVIDLDRAGPGGVLTVGAIRDASDRARVLVITDDESAALLASALGAGACGFVPRRIPTEQLLRGLRRAVAGELVIPERDLHRIVGRLRRGGPDVSDEVRLASLTARETEILRALAGGHSTSEIASDFGISPLTVQSHVKSILAKLGVHSKVEAVTLAWRLGLCAASRTA